MAKGDTFPRFKTPGRARLRGLLVLAPFFVLEFTALSGSRSDGAEFFLGSALWFATRIVAIALTLVVGAALGGRFVWFSIGIGPRLSRRVVGNHVLVVCPLPIAVGGLLVPKEESFARTHRIFTGSLLLPLALAGAVVPLVHGYAALTLAVMPVCIFIVAATSRDPGSGRSIAARVFVRPTEHNEPLFTRPDRIRAARSACLDVQFGDLDQAEAVLAQLRGEPDAEFGAAMLAVELFAARGDFDSALRVRFPEPGAAEAEALTEARRAADSARAAKLLMLVAEKDPALAAKAVPLAQQHIAAIARTRRAPQADRTGRALYALQAGDLETARRLNRAFAARARTPLAIADALCTQARIEALRGRPKQAAKALAEAAKFAPWYPRVATVRQMAGAGSAVPLPQPTLASAETDTSHVFAEPWSISAPSANADEK